MPIAGAAMSLASILLNYVCDASQLERAVNFATIRYDVVSDLRDASNAREH